MEFEAKLAELGQVAREHREVLLTEEAAKTTLVLPLLQATGYNVFSPGEVVPEFTCGVGSKKVDFAVCDGGEVRMFVECKPANVELNVSHASQLFRYVAVIDTRVALLTNGVDFQSFSDIENPNKMDDKPFFSFCIGTLRQQDIRTLGRFKKHAFDIEQIVAEVAQLKMQSLVTKELQRELAEPSEEMVRLIAARVHGGRMTPTITDSFRDLIIASFAALVRDKVNERLNSAPKVTDLSDDTPELVAQPSEDDVETTEDEVTGYHIVRATASKLVDPKRIVMRGVKSYCAILLDDNNRKTTARLHFNSPTTRYFGTFTGKEEQRHQLGSPVEIYQHGELILQRLQELAN